MLGVWEERAGMEVRVGVALASTQGPWIDHTVPRECFFRVRVAFQLCYGSTLVRAKPPPTLQAC